MSENSLTRRQFLQAIGVGSAALALGSPLIADEKRKPNIVLILADDLGYGGVGVQGCKDIPTPSIDSIAANGVRFTNGYVSCPVCSPTRAGLMTGRYQQRFGYELNPGPPDRADPKFGLPLTETTIASRLKSAGYATGIVGKWHLGYKPELHPQKRGFDEFFGFLAGAHSYVVANDPRIGPIMRGTTPVEEKEYLTDALGREAVSFIDRHKKEPFFLYLSFNAVHSPLQGGKYSQRFSHLSTDKRREHAGQLTAMDDQIGNVLSALRKNNLEEDTLVIFLSDNGGPTPGNTSSNLPLRGFKADVLEGGIRVPFMMQWKNTIPKGELRDDPVIALDIAATASALAGAKSADAKFDGVDILPYAKGKAGAPHETLYWRYGNQSAIRHKNWKLVKMPKQSKPQLYDLSKDIAEATDLASTQPARAKELEDMLAKWDAQLMEPQWGRSGRDPVGAAEK